MIEYQINSDLILTEAQSTVSNIGFAKVYRSGIKNIAKLKSSIPLFLYMLSYLNRGQRWLNTLDYYQDGFLVFARHQKYIARDFDVSQQAISYHIRKLEKIGYVRHIGTHKLTRQDYQICTKIYALGEWDVYGGTNAEFYYYTLEDDHLEYLLNESDSICFHRIFSYNLTE